MSIFITGSSHPPHVSNACQIIELVASAELPVLKSYISLCYIRAYTVHRVNLLARLNLGLCLPLAINRVNLLARLNLGLCLPLAINAQQPSFASFLCCSCCRNFFVQMPYPLTLYSKSCCKLSKLWAIAKVGWSTTNSRLGKVHDWQWENTGYSGLSLLWHSSLRWWTILIDIGLVCMAII